MKLFCLLILLALVVLGVFLIFHQKKEKIPQATATLASSQASRSNPSNKPSQSIQSSSSQNQTPASSVLALSFDTTLLTSNAQSVYYGVYYFNTNQELSSNNSAPTPSASIIKVFIMAYVFSQKDAGNLSLDETVSGDTLLDLVTRMIQVSDNDATNSLINHFGMATLNSYFQSQGYTDTKLERLMLDNAARASGLDNYTSLTDCMSFLKRLYENQNQPSDAQMLQIMKGQQVRTKIPSQLPAGTVVANKTGELDDVESDIGIVFKPNDPFAIVVLTHNFTSVSAIHTAIGNLALQAYQQ